LHTFDIRAFEKKKQKEFDHTKYERTRLRLLMTFWMIYVLGFGVIWLCVTGVWLLSLPIKDASIVDIFWGSGFVVVGWAYFLLTDTTSARAWVLMMLVSLWGLRLTAYLAWRNIGTGEDFRYRQWRKEAGADWWWRSYIKVFLLQGVIMWLVSLPLLGAQYTATPARLNGLDVLAIVGWCAGFLFEVVGDYQLARFKSQPQNAGKVLNTGLWRYTRHPNYFGDAVQWWAFYLMALAAGAWWTIISPIIMTVFLRYISGVTLLEKTLQQTKPDYRAYIRRTSPFVPMPPRD